MAELRRPGRLSASADLAGICPADPAIAIPQFHPGHITAGVLLYLKEGALRARFSPSREQHHSPEKQRNFRALTCAFAGDVKLNFALTFKIFSKPLLSFVPG